MNPIICFICVMCITSGTVSVLCIIFGAQMVKETIETTDKVIGISLITIGTVFICFLTYVGIISIL